jgi:Fe-S cluster assembly iron-binding protein IscA
MIRLTERAAEALKEMLTANQTPDDQGVKLFPDPSGGIAMTIAPVTEGDEVVDEGNRPLLIVDAEIVVRFDGAVLDLTVSDNGNEPRFELRGPPRSAPSG